MPPAAKTPGIDAGTQAEVRVAQAWFWDGCYVRRGVDLQHRFGADVSLVTDLDVLCIAFDDSLVAHKYIGEVKTGTSKSTPRPLDRALWIRGLREVVGAEASEVTTALRVSNVVRDVCNRLGTTIQHLDDLQKREMRLRISEVADMGSQGETVALLRAEVASFVKSDAILERGYWFLVSEVWFLEPFDALKRTLGLIRQLSKAWPPETDRVANRVARWFFAEAISIAMVNIALVARKAVTMDPKSFADTATAQLSSGDIPFHSMRALSDRVDEYVGKLLASVDAPADMLASAIGAFVPSPPSYAEPLLELIMRLAAEASITARLPRQLDLILFERLVHQRQLAPALYPRLNLTPSTERMMRLVAAFLRGQFSIPEPVDKALTSSLAPSPSRPPSSKTDPTSSDAPRSEGPAAQGPPPAATTTTTAPEPTKRESSSDTDQIGVLPRVEGVGSPPLRQNRSQTQTRRWQLVLENQTDSPVTDVTFHYEDTNGQQVLEFDVLAGKHHSIDLLAPHESVEFPLLQVFGSPQSAICAVEWSDKEGQRHSSRVTVQVP